ncbi:MAG: hypothetical protein QOD06_485, partial [Candidatus Binatota bacterium]|nr:hypothetical protein [Candidatus Binatota bacterium]
MNGCRKRAIERPLVVLALLFVAPGCVLETRPVSLETASPPSATTATTGSPLVAVGSFADDRGESSRWIGSIRGPLGNPLYTLEGTAPVSQLVAAA